MRFLFPFLSKYLLFLLFGLFFLFPQISLAQSAYVKDIQGILSLGSLIDRESRIDMKQVLEKKRLDLLTETLRIQKTLKTRFTEKPTIDFTGKYRLFIQKYSLSCEIAAVHILFETITKKSTTEESIFSHFPVFPGSKVGEIWGDPDKYFVGDIRGRQSNFTGFGVYPPVVSDFFKIQKISSWMYSGSDGRDLSSSERLTTILTSLENGYHVMLWGDYCTQPSEEDGIMTTMDVYVSKFLGIAGINHCFQNSDARKLSWKTPEGKNISALSGEHVFILLGYFGDRTAPTYIIVWDTKTGKHVYSRAEWMRKWKLLDYRALIVNPHAD